MRVYGETRDVNKREHFLIECWIHRGFSNFFFFFFFFVTSFSAQTHFNSFTFLSFTFLSFLTIPPSPQHPTPEKLFNINAPSHHPNDIQVLAFFMSGAPIWGSPSSPKPLIPPPPPLHISPTPPVPGTLILLYPPSTVPQSPKNAGYSDIF